MTVRVNHSAIPRSVLLPTIMIVLASCAVQRPDSQTLNGSAPTPAPDPTAAATALPDPTVSEKAQQPVWTPSPAAPGEVVYPGFGIRTMPAPADSVVKVSLEQALQSAAVVDFREGGLAPGEPQSTLRLFSNGDLAPGAPSPSPLLTNELAWFLTFGGSPADYHGPPGFVPPSPRPMCNFYVVIDALTGATLLDAQDCSATR